MHTFRSRATRIGVVGAAGLLSLVGLSIVGVLPAGAQPSAPPAAVTATLSQGASSATASDGTATVTWVDSTDATTQGYIVTPELVAENLGTIPVSPPQAAAPVTVPSPTATKATITGLKAYGTYVFSVSAAIFTDTPPADAGSTATTAPVTVTIATNYSFAGPTGFAQESQAGAAIAPPIAGSGSTFTVTLPGGSQVVPSTDSGVGLNFILGTTQYYELPQSTTGSGGATVLGSPVISGNLTWTGGSCVNVKGVTPATCTASPPVSAVPSSGNAPITAIVCTHSGQTGCDAANNSALVADSVDGIYSGFDGPNPTFPYLEVSTGSTEIPHGATLTLPNVTVAFSASGTVGSSITTSEFEFATSANISLGGGTTIQVVGWPSKGLYSTSTTPQCNGLTLSSGSCPAVTFVPLNAVDGTGSAAGTFDTELEYGGAPFTLTSTLIVPPLPSIQVTNATPINSSQSGVTINVTGSNWPTAGTFTGGLVWSGSICGPSPNASCNDVGNFTVTGGALSGSILFGPNEQLPTSSSPITLTLTASDGTNHATVNVTVNPYQSFQTFCSFSGPGHCTINQLISAPVIGTSLTISEVGQSPTQSTVTLSTVTLGLAQGDNQSQFANATGSLNAVTVNDDRGTLGGWDVTGQLAGDFNNVGTQVGPPGDNVIPADFLTWGPSVALETAGGLPGNNANTTNCPSASGPCVGPSGLPSTTGLAGGAGGNGTGAAVGSTSAPAEVTAGPLAVLNNPAGSAQELCGTSQKTGGGGAFVCNASLSLAIPPYVAAGIYQDTLNLLVMGY